MAPPPYDPRAGAYGAARGVPPRPPQPSRPEQLEESYPAFPLPELPRQQPAPPAPPQGGLSNAALATIGSLIGIGSVVLGCGITFGALKGDVDRAKADATLARAEVTDHLHDVEIRRLDAMKARENHDARLRALEAMQSDTSRIVRSNDVMMSKLDALCRALPKANCGP